MAIYLDNEEVGVVFFDNGKFRSLVDRTITEINTEDLDGIINIGSSAFTYCHALISIEIPNSVTSIGSSAFYDCRSLTSVTIPDSVTSIGVNVFQQCTSLTSMNYLGTLEQWCNVTLLGSFSNPTWFTKTLTIQGKTISGELVVPDTITEIKNYTFYNCQGITSVIIHDKITSIGKYAFTYCHALISIEIPNSVKTIGSTAFYKCSNLTSVTIGSGVTSIGGSAFYGCTSLKTITIKATTPPTLGSTNAIPSATETIYIPNGTLSAYSTATNWSAFAEKFVEMDMGE